MSDFSAVHDPVFRHVRSAPDSCAVRDVGGGVDAYGGADAIGYRELWDLAGTLAGSGIRPGDLIAVAQDRSVDLVVTLLAAARAGLAYLPLDSTSPPDGTGRSWPTAGRGALTIRGGDRVAGQRAGRAADLLGSRNTTVLLMALQGVSICGCTLVDSTVALAVATVLVLSSESATDAARGTLIAGLFDSTGRVRAWSYLRAVSNFEVSLGAIAGGATLSVDDGAVYRGALVTAGLLVVAASVCYLLVPRVVEPADGPRWVVLRDRPYAAFVTINAVLMTNAGLLVVALLIWITERTSVPPVWPSTTRTGSSAQAT